MSLCVKKIDLSDVGDSGFEKLARTLGAGAPRARVHTHTRLALACVERSARARVSFHIPRSEARRSDKVGAFPTHLSLFKLNVNSFRACCGPHGSSCSLLPGTSVLLVANAACARQGMCRVSRQQHAVHRLALKRVCHFMTFADQPVTRAEEALPKMSDKERAEALKTEGNAFLKAKDYASAEECYTKALELDPSVEAFYTNRSLVRTNMGKYDEAVQDCFDCLKANPRSARAYGRMGSAQFKAGRYQESVEAYQAALEIDPGNDTYRQGLEVASSRVSDAATGAGNGEGSADTVSQLQSILTAAAAGSTSAQVKSVHESSADMTIGMARSARAMNLFNEIKADYEAELSKASTDDEREQVLEQLHERSAPKVLALARNNGGIYNKAAQFVASLQGGAGDKGVPKAYVKALAVLTDGAPFKDFSAMEPVLVEEFGKKGDSLFQRIDRTPIAAASLAQVHRAVSREGESVAVKLLYPALRKEMASDFAVFRMVGAQIKPGGFDLQWLVKDFEDALSMELDFEVEARNAMTTARILQSRRNVRVPRVVESLSCKSVLTMEFIEDMFKVSDKAAISNNHLDPLECGTLIADVFHEMALVHGHVHGDPHAGNVYLRVHSCTPSGCTPELVLLDHGLYHRVPDAMRRDLCRLLLASVSPFATRGQREKLATRFAGPLFRYFPPILSPWFVFSSRLTAADIRAAAKQQLPQTVSIKDVGECLVALHDSQGDGGNMLGVLHSFGYTRGLLNALDYPERLRLRSMIKYATIGLMPAEQQVLVIQKGASALPISSRLRLVAGDVYVYMLWILIPLLALVAPILFLYEIWRDILLFAWSLNPLTWWRFNRAE